MYCTAPGCVAAIKWLDIYISFTNAGALQQRYEIDRLNELVCAFVSNARVISSYWKRDAGQYRRPYTYYIYI